MTWGADVPGGIPFSGNVSLSGCRLVGAGGADDALALDWSRNPGSNCAALWRFNEAAYTGATGEVLDAIGTAHGQAMNGAQTATTGMTRALQTVGASDQYVRFPYSSVFAHTGSGAVAAWVYWDGSTYSGNRLYIRTNSSSYWGIALFVEDDGTPRLLLVRGGTMRALSGTVALGNGWNYLVGRWDASKQYCDLYTTAGVYRDSMSSSGSIRQGKAVTTIASDIPAAPYRTLRTDELAIYNQEMPQSAFDALGYWYPASGSATLTGAGLATRVPTAVSWTATVGAEYGAVSTIELLDAALGWTQVGGDNPTSPISVSGITLAADASVRVTLTPKADAIRSETPILQDLTLTYADAATYIPRRISPIRIGPRLLPIGVI
jgi:hypothetical protein